MNKISFAHTIAWQVLPNMSFAYACNYDTRKYFKFEETGLVIWLCIADNAPISQNDLQVKIADYYGVGHEVVEQDVNEFITSLFEEGLIEYNE